MGRTLLTTREIGSVQRNDFDTTTSGQAVTTRIIAGTGISLSSTGVDTGTGDVTITATGGGGTPGGSTTQIQFNDAGAFGGDADFTWDKTGNKLTLGGVDTGMILTGITNEPAAPSAGNLHLYTKSSGGRMVLKMKGPSGIDTSLQPALYSNNTVLYAPSSGTTGTGTGWGTVWTPNGTVAHPTSSSTAPALANQMRRTTFTNVVTTTNQTMGIMSTAAGMPQFWVGNASGLGGFFFWCRFTLEAMPAATTRLFIGLTDLATSMVASDAPTGNFVGLHRITTDAVTTMAFATRNNTTTTRATFTIPTILTKIGYDFTMFCAPNGTSVSYRLVTLDLATSYVNTSTSTTLPLNTAFMGPQALVSNGTANVTVATTTLGINRLYVESDV